MVTAEIRSKVREIATRVVGQRILPSEGSEELDNIANDLEQELNNNWQPIHKLYAHDHCKEAILDLSKAPPPLPPAAAPRAARAVGGGGGKTGKGAKAKIAREKAEAEASRATDNETRLQIESAQGVLNENEAEASDVALEEVFAKSHFDFCLSAFQALTARPLAVDGEISAALFKVKVDLQARALLIADKCLEFDWAREYRASRYTPAGGAVPQPAMAEIPGRVRVPPKKQTQSACTPRRASGRARPRGGSCP